MNMWETFFQESFVHVVGTLFDRVAVISLVHYYFITILVLNMYLSVS